MKTLRNIEEATGQKGYHGLFSTHPETEERIIKAEEEAKKVTQLPGNHFIQFREQYLSKIDGLIFGDDPKEGVVVRNVFRHPDLRIELTFPQGWTINNGRELLAAKHPEKNYFIQMKLIVLDKKLSAEEFAKKIEERHHLNIISGFTQIINGIKAYVGAYQGMKKGMGEIKVKMASIIVEDKGYIVMGFSPSSSFKEATPFFTSTINSFKRLSLKEASMIKPHKIRIYTVKEGDTWESIARKFGQKTDEAKTLALINACDPATPPQPGTSIKLISAYL